MTLGEFRQLTQNMSDNAEICILIDADWVHPHASYKVTSESLEYDNGCFETPTGIVLRHRESEFKH